MRSAPGSDHAVPEPGISRGLPVGRALAPALSRAGQFVAAGWRWLPRVAQAGGSIFRWRKAGKQRAEIRRRLHAIAESLGGMNARTEPEFVHLARILRGLHANATGLANSLRERFGAIRGALADSRIAGSEGMAVATLTAVRAGLDAASNRMASLHAVVGGLHRLRTEVQEIQRIGIRLRSSIVGFAVESSRSARLQQAFGAFVEELRDLAARISEGITAIASRLAATGKSLGGGLHSMDSSLQAIGALMGQLEATAIATANEAQALLDASITAVERAELRGHDIGRHADGSVYYLQFGDIVRQKMEHVIAAIQDAIAGMDTRPTGADFASRAAAIDRMAAIQIAQIDLIRKEITAARDRLASGFEGIAGSTAELVTTLRDWLAPVANPGRSTHAFENFRGEVTRLKSLQDQGHQLCHDATVTARGAMEETAQLQHHLGVVRRINAEIQLQAINAIIKTAALGDEGNTLAVLAQQVEWLYSESNASLRQVTATVEGIVRDAETTSTIPEISVEQHEIHARLQASLDRTGGAFEDLRAASRATFDLAQPQGRLLDDGRAQLAFLSEMDAVLSSSAGELTNVRQHLKFWRSLTPNLPAAESTADSLLDHYSMQTEREIHLRVALKPAAADREPSDTGAGRIPGSQPGPAMAGLELPSIPTLHEPVPSTDNLHTIVCSPPVPGSAPEESLGDNVELF